MWRCKYFAIFCWILWIETISICGQGGSKCLKESNREILEKKNLKLTRCSNKNPGNKCTVTCKDGFNFKTNTLKSNTQELKCAANAKRFQNLKECVNITAESGGRVSGSERAGVNVMAQSTPKTTTPSESKSCNSIDNLSGGNLKKPNCGQTAQGGVCQLRCKRGYNLPDNSVTQNITCLASGNWSTFQNCSEKTCSPAHSQLPNVNCTNGNKFLSTCTFRCNADENLVGEKDLVCDFSRKANSLSWSSKIPICKAIRCKQYTYNDRGYNIACPNGDLGSTCLVKCASGYRLNGENILTCSKNSRTKAAWSELIGTCAAIKCEPIPIPTPRSGLIKPKTIQSAPCPLNVGSACEYECDNGYEFVDKKPKKTVRCELGDGTASWSPKISSIGGCQRKILKHNWCQYWISNIKAKNKSIASKKCKELLGSESVLAVTANASVKNFLSTNIKEIYKKEDPYLIGAKKPDNGKWIWDNKEKITTALSSGKCAVLHANKITSKSCSQKFICEKPTDALNGICSPNLCKNGKCISYGCSYKCICEKKFFGRHCDSGPMTLEFKKNISFASQNQKAIIYVKMNTKLGGKASLDLYQNGDNIETYEINAENSTTGTQLDYKQYTIENVKENIYVSARGMLQTDAGNSYLYACTKIMPNERKIKEVQVSKDQCDATNLLVRWNKLTSTARLKYTIYVGDVKTYSSTHEETSHILSGLEPNKKYKIKVVPDIKGCNNKLDLFDAYEGETAKALPAAPEKVDLKIAEKNCKIRWRQTHQKGFGGYQVRMSETARSSSSTKQNEKQQYKELTLKNTTSQGYSFMTNPNSIYMVRIGTIPTEDCEERVPIAWSDEIEGCGTGTAPPGKVKTPTLDLSLNQDQTVPITLSPVDERNGPASCYFVVIKIMNSSENSNTSKPITDISLLKQGNETINAGDHFVSVALKRFQTEQNLILGKGESSCCDMRGSNNSCEDNLASTRKRRAAPNTAVNANNRELIPDAEYSHYVLVSTPSSDGGEPMLTASEYSPVWSVKKEDTGPQDGINLLAIILPIVIILLLVILVVTIILYKRRHSKKSGDGAPAENIMMRRNNRPNQEDYSLSVEDLIEVEVDRARENPDEVVDRILSDRHLLLLSNLYQVMADKRANEDMLFMQELKTDIPNAIKACKLTTDIAKLPANIPKNRYKNIVPYDHTRVVLGKLPGDEFSDYVNAAFIDGYKFPNKFIATQGPKPNTINDFWRMIWEHNCAVIAVLTRLEEKKKTKCERYWSENEDQVAIYDGITVNLTETVSYGDYIGRKFEVTKGGEVRKVVQYQYIAWPDHGIPDTTSSIMRFHRSVVSAQPASAGPIVVHCSAGVGRTGTFIALDILYDQIYETEEINICSIVGKMRTRRPEMVQTLEQYIYIHKLILELYQFGETDVDVTGFNAVYSDMLSTNGQSRKIDEEFAMLDYFLPLSTDQDTGSKTSNKTLNRDPSVVPYDHNAAFIPMNPTDKNVPYINASNIRCYQSTEKFIAAQTPTEASIEMFWRAIFDNGVTMVVSLCEKGKPDDFTFWPKKNEQSNYGLINVRTIEENSSMGCTERTFVLTNNDKKVTVQQIYYGQWAESVVPASSGIILEIIANIERHHLSHGGDQAKTTLVHCSDGAGRTGAFCAISNLIERLKNENKVDVFRTVKDLRDQRPLMVRTVEQYEFCYQAVTDFLQSFDLYGNFQ